LQPTNNYRKGEQAGTTSMTLRALRAYKEDLDQAITAFSAYAATYERRGIIAMPVVERNVDTSRERRERRN